MTKPIRIKNSDEFDALIEGLAHDIVDANVHFRLHQNLSDSIADYCIELNQSRAFWNLTISAQLDAALLRLCRAYDSDSSSLSLPRLLATIECNPDIFDTPDFKERLMDNPFVEGLTDVDRIPDKDDLVADIKLVSKRDPFVSRLLKWRNNIGAHRDPRETITPNSVVGDPLNFTEIEYLLTSAIGILNRYSSLFKAVTYSTSMVGADDYSYVLGCIKRDITEREREFEEEMAKCEKSSP